jgi:hypothetical protein
VPGVGFEPTTPVFELAKTVGFIKDAILLLLLLLVVVVVVVVKVK